MDNSSGPITRQYDAYPYPEPLVEIPKDLSFEGEPSAYSPLFWPEGKPREDLRILSAGCGTNQAAHVAYRNPRCSVVGIDLSEAALSHEKYLREKHCLTNLTLHLCDLRDVGTLRREFDLIICTGVLHHMEKPDDGLRALASVLSANGVMSLLVYGAVQRIGIYLIQDICRRLRILQDQEGITRVREILHSLPPYHIAHWSLRHVADVKFDAGIVDLFLHSKDCAYTVPQLLDLIDRCSLKFQCWLDNHNYFPDGHVSTNTRLWSMIEEVPEREQWAIIESLFMAPEKHSFVVCHPHRKDSAIDFDHIDWMSYFPVRHPQIKIIERANLQPERPGKFQRGNRSFQLSPAEALLLGVDGKTTIENALTHPLIAKHPLEHRQSFGRQFYKRMWRLGHMFFSRVPAPEFLVRPSSATRKSG